MYDQKNNAENTRVDFIGVNKYWSDASHAAACQSFDWASEHGGTQSAKWSFLLLVVCTFTEFTVDGIIVPIASPLTCAPIINIFQ